MADFLSLVKQGPKERVWRSESIAVCHPPTYWPWPSTRQLLWEVPVWTVRGGRSFQGVAHGRSAILCTLSSAVQAAGGVPVVSAPGHQ